MTPEEFTQSLAALGWKQSDFCRMAGLNKSTPSRWVTLDAPIPDWVPRFLGMATEVQRLYETYVKPPKVPRAVAGK